MTDRLYYTDPTGTVFDATVVSVERRDDRLSVRLDRSSFYPTSGGQPHDTGLLGTLRVVDVREEEADGDVVHIIDASPSAGLSAGEAVRGVVDRDRRFDHMQQHTGQHVLSAAFDRLFGARTVGFHLGAEVSTIDLDRELKGDEIAAAELEANRIVWENRTVAIRFAAAGEATGMPLRKESKREGTLRLIDIEEFDLSACGGTHVGRTGAIGIIAVDAWERFKGGQRLEFVCGGRALRRFRRMRDTLAIAGRVLSVGSEDLPASIERLQLELKDQRKLLASLHGELAVHRSAELATAAEETPRGRLVLRAIDGDANALKTLASAIVSRPGYVVVLVSPAAPALTVVARSSDQALSALALIAALTAKFGGRGGGRPDLAQAGGLNGQGQEILDAARDYFFT